MKLKSEWRSLVRPVLALATITSISFTGIHAIPAHASIPGDGEYSCSTGTLSTDVAIPRYTITDGVLDSGSFCVGAVVIAPGVTSIGAWAFEEGLLETITIPNSVISIGNNAFRDSGLISISLPSSITSIGSAAFRRAESLNSVTIQNGLSTIGLNVFRETASLTSISIPNSVTTIGLAAFASSGLTSISIPDSVTTIEACAFCFSDLESISLPNNITSIQDETFAGTNLLSVTIPSSVTSIENWAFRYTSGLESVTIPEGVTQIGDEAFAGAINLANVYFLGDAPTVGTDTFLNLPIDAIAFVRPTATGFEQLGDPWNGLTVQYTSPLYKDWEEPLPTISNGPMAGETIYATAFERPLSRNLFKPDELNGNYFTDVANYPTPEEYVYRITRTPNVEATSVDHQSSDGYEMLSATAQQDWYSEISPTTPYLFSWKAFMCVGDGAPSIPPRLSSRYASREDGIRPNASFSSYQNRMFRDAATAWTGSTSASTRTLVGPKISVGGGYTEALLGDPDSNGYWSKVFGILDVTSSCGVGKTLEALTIVDSGDNPITTKSFVVPSQLRLDVPGTNVLVDPTGITIGVTGALSVPEFHAALWGLTTVFDSTTPPPAPGTPGTTQATAGNGQATVQITAPTSGGTPTSYTVTATPGGATCSITVPATSCTVTGLTNGTAYTFSSTATNTGGTSAASASSNSVTPSAPAAPASITAPAVKLATTGANVEWLMFAGLIATIAGSGFLAFSRRKRIW